MRKMYGVVAAFSLLLQGCTAVTKDLRHPGGYPGYVMDKRMFDASKSKQLMLLRVAIIVAMAARMSNGTIQNPDEANNVASNLASATDEINFAAADVYWVDGIPPCEVAPETWWQQIINRVLNAHDPVATHGSQPPETLVTGCNGYYVNFESELPLLESRVSRLMFSTLPQSQMKSFAGDVEKGNVLGGAWNALKLVFAGIKGLHYAAGSYRSGEEALVANRPTCDLKRSESEMTVYDAVDCI